VGRGVPPPEIEKDDRAVKVEMESAMISAVRRDCTHAAKATVTIFRII
jgi:hypothetical protein